MEKIINELKAFFAEGYNMYYVIAGAVVLVALIIVIVACSVKAKRKKAASEDVTAEPVSEANEEKEDTQAADSVPSELSDYAGEPEVDYPDGTIDVDRLEVYSDDFREPAGEAVVTKTPVRSNSGAESVVMSPVEAKEKPAKKVAEPEPEHVAAEKESNFNKDYIFVNEPVRRPGTIQIYKDAGGKFRFRMKSHNGETVGHSQGYTTKSSCKAGVNAVINASKTAIVADTTKDDKYTPTIGRAAFEVYRDSERKFRFRLTAANASNILASQGYTSKANCINGIEGIRRIAELHKVVDDTVVK